MSALRNLEVDFVRADLSAARSVLAQLPAGDVLTRFSLEERVEELEARVAELAHQMPALTASAALFFGGQPVIGARGIESEFGGRIVIQFQDLVSKLLADRAGALGARGIVPNKDRSTLHITNVVRGSFGFLMEEGLPDGGLFDSPLKEAIEATQQLMRKLSSPDEGEFQAAVETVDQRVLAAARDFFEILRSSGATLRMVVDQDDTSFGVEAINRAVARATGTEVRDEEVQLQGRLNGTLPEAHQFEFDAGGERGLIRGKAAKEIPAADLLEMNRTLVGLQASARLTARRVLQNGEVVREAFTLLGLDQIE